METGIKLNLARSWRSKNFEEIIGQDITVRVLKNSLYLNQFFPVYLFSGQRGCGKTSTARVFTAAVNCELLESFQTNPKENSIPCQKCSSCLAMQTGKHPDFIEIDAASHTGVDHVRQIIEAASFMPLLGRKKIYLIDEVHMLSKAAFNALLKILEEPPDQVMFILATTDLHKVIDTVKSRSFQLFFGPPKQNELLDHLQNICNKEQIAADSDALKILIKEAGGSVRDAINLLEQVRFIDAKVTVDTVLNSLGYISDEQLLKVIELLLHSEADKLLNYLQELDFSTRSAEFIWRRLLELLRATIYVHYGVVGYVDEINKEAIDNIVQQFTVDKIVNLLECICDQELLFYKTAYKSLFLEILFLRFMQTPKSGAVEVGVDARVENSDQKKNKQLEHTPSRWDQFLGIISQSDEPILLSIFKQAKFVSQSEDAVTIAFTSQSLFFVELIDEKKSDWHGYLQQIFGSGTELIIGFDEEVVVDLPQVAYSDSAVTTSAVARSPKARLAKTSYRSQRGGGGNKLIDVSDKDKWPLANELLEHFPGQVYEVTE